MHLCITVNIAQLGKTILEGGEPLRVRCQITSKFRCAKSNIRKKTLDYEHVGTV